jgi:hypothetical protein
MALRIVLGLLPGVLSLHLLHHLFAKTADLGRTLDHHVLRALISEENRLQYVYIMRII